MAVRFIVRNTSGDMERVSQALGHGHLAREAPCLRSLVESRRSEAENCRHQAVGDRAPFSRSLLGGRAMMDRTVRIASHPASLAKPSSVPRAALPASIGPTLGGSSGTSEVYALAGTEVS